MRKLSIPQNEALSLLKESPLPEWTTKAKVVSLIALESRGLAKMCRYTNGLFFEITDAGQDYLKAAATTSGEAVKDFGKVHKVSG